MWSVEQRLSDLYWELRKARDHSLGYPLNQNVVPMSSLLRFLEFNLNNLGDPFAGGSYAVNTFDFEKRAVLWFADFLGLPREQAWGYVTSSGSESNLTGIYTGGRRFGSAFYYATRQSHYSVKNAIRYVRGSLVYVDSFHDGSIDLEDFRSKIKGKHTAVVCLNVGTTMSGAVDDVQAVCQILRQEKVKAHVHVDAALGGLLLGLPLFLMGADSVAISGHKLLGTPLPCAIYLSYERHRPQEPVEYVGSNNSTLFGSRSGLASLILWYALDYYGKEGIQKLSSDCFAMKAYALAKLQEIGYKHWSPESSTTIVLEKPRLETVKKWQLACEGDWAHIVVMPHVCKQKLDEFIQDLKKEVIHGEVSGGSPDRSCTGK